MIVYNVYRTGILICRATINEFMRNRVFYDLTDICSDINNGKYIYIYINNVSRKLLQIIVECTITIILYYIVYVYV